MRIWYTDASDSFSTMVLYKSIYILTYLLTYLLTYMKFDMLPITATTHLDFAKTVSCINKPLLLRHAAWLPDAVATVCFHPRARIQLHRPL